MACGYREKVQRHIAREGLREGAHSEIVARALGFAYLERCVANILVEEVSLRAR